MEKHICIYVLVTRPICSRKVCQLDMEKGMGDMGDRDEEHVKVFIRQQDRHLSFGSSIIQIVIEIVLCHPNRPYGS